MNNYNQDLQSNQRHWDRMVAEDCGFTKPFLDLNADDLRTYATGGPKPWEEQGVHLTPPDILQDIDGKDVLLLGLGGGQQSAMFGILGARVTSVDLCEGQLAADRMAAAHYGYEITTIRSDMGDLSDLSASSFDLVFGASTCYTPDIRAVHREAARVIRSGGVYRTQALNPMRNFIKWDGRVYSVTAPYSETIERSDDSESIEFRHYMHEIFSLIEFGFAVERVFESTPVQPDPGAVPGTWEHERNFLGGIFVIVARMRHDLPNPSSHP